jgi:predicted AAA+ superfamily ATPase
MVADEIERKIRDLDEIGFPDIVPRNVIVNMAQSTVSTLIGARRSGKSYRAMQIAGELVENGTLPSIKHVCFLDFDNSILASASASDLVLIQKTFLKLRVGFDLKTPILFILDEIQKIEGWENYVVELSRNTNWIVIVTGSSSKMLGTEIATALRGKALPTWIYPLSFGEFIKFRGSHQTVGSTTGDAEAMRLFDEYLKWGGYPAIAVAQDRVKEPLLREYFDTMTLRDIIQRNSVSNPKACMFTLRTLLSMIAKPYTIKSLVAQVRAAGYMVSWETVKDYIEWGEDAQSFLSMQIFSDSHKEQQRNYSKMYAVDWAMANCNSPVWDGALSRAFENLIYLHLRRSWSRVNYYLTRSQRREIDFLAVNSNGSIEFAIQACYDISDPVTRQREVEPLIATAKYLGIRECLILTNNLQEILEIDGVTISIQPAWRWLLMNEKK